MLGACSTDAVNAPSSGKLLGDLESITVEALRERDYSADVLVEAFDTDSCVGEHPITVLPSYDREYASYMAAFHSDGIRQYARITVPTNAPPPEGYPFVLFLHGWIGKDKAPNYSIGCRPENLYYSELTDAFARAGYAVLSPGYRGHASVNGVPADGIEYMEAFDQGSALSTQFYAVDVLNFASGIEAIDGSKFPGQAFKFDMSRFFLVGHSQGGDAGLTYLAATGEGHRDDLSPTHAALWSGTFYDRLAALEDVKPVAMTPQAFLAGDGTWTGTATGLNGEINPKFVYGYPPDWIETPNPDEWTWQKDSWSEPDVKAAAVQSAETMYRDLEAHIDGLSGISFDVVEDDDGTFSLIHDPRVAEAFAKIGGFEQPGFLTENLTFHVPEKDHYSRVAWNQDLCDRIMNKGGKCNLIIYPHNNHSMRASSHEWFSPAGTPDGYPQMVANMLTEFSAYQENN